MNELIKIRDISAKYNVSARTLRYYEDMGLITSIRSNDYAYRLYDETAVKRLEQILILRKLNISIKDIQRIFSTSGSEVVLEVLGKKVDSIDEEVSLLHELKEIVLEFIRQIEQADFGKESDVKLLYKKAKEIETQLVNVDYNGNPSNINRLLEVNEKLNTDKMPDIRVIRLPKCKMATSGEPDAAVHEVWNFSNWWKEYDKKRRAAHYAPMDFLFGENRGAVWWMMVEDDATSADCGGYEIIDFEGGLYAVHTSIDGDSESHQLVNKKIMKWLENTGFERDDRHGNRSDMGHMINPDEEIKEGLGYHQYETFVPIKLRKQEKQRNFTLAPKTNGVISENTHKAEIERLKQVIDKLDAAALRGKNITIDLFAMEKVGKTDVKYIDKKLIMSSKAGSEAGMLTPQSFTVPLRISCRAMTDSTNLRLYYNKGEVILNWELNLDELRTNDPLNGDVYGYENQGRIPMNEFVDIEWTIGRKVMTLKIDGKLRHASDNYEYIKVLRESPEMELSYPVLVRPAFGSTVTVESLTVTELK